MAHIAAELAWVASLLRDLGIGQPKAPTLFCYKLSALHLTCSLVPHACNKYIKIDYHYVQEWVSLKVLQTLQFPSSLQVSNVFTKPLTCFILCSIMPQTQPHPPT